MNNSSTISEALDRILVTHPPVERLSHDPLGVVRELPATERVIAAHVAASLAYGSVQLIRRAIRDVIAGLRTVTSLEEATFSLSTGELSAVMPDWRYRMSPVDAVESYLVGLSRLLERYGSLGHAFGEKVSPDALDTRPALEAYVAELRSLMPSNTRGARYLTPDPATGSACKRWHLMLRWLCRPDDGVDLGEWRYVRPDQLLLPLDRHVASLVRSLGFTDRATVDYRMSREATDALRQFSADDPLRYDMALCHLGVSGRCLHRFELEVCQACHLQALCRWTRD